MKKITKLLLAGTIIGLTTKVIYDNFEIRIRKHEEIEPPKEPNPVDEWTFECDIKKPKENKNEDDDKKIFSTSLIDQVHYDNPYGICEIGLDERGCPDRFIFKDQDKRDAAKDLFERMYLDCKDEFLYVTLNQVFKILGLIIDDYDKFKYYSSTLDASDFDYEYFEDNILYFNTFKPSYVVKNQEIKNAFAKHHYYKKHKESFVVKEEEN